VNQCFCVLFICFATALFAKPNPDFSLSSVYNEPSVYVEGKVNAITGEFYDLEEDLVIHGAEAIHIKRVYLNSTRKSWILLPHTLATIDFSQGLDYCTIGESNGGKVRYQKVSERRNRGKLIARYEPCDLDNGFSNTSGKNLKNNYVIYDEETNQLTLNTTDGIERVFEKRRHSNDTSQGKSWLLFSEHLPNGNWILYDYTKIKDKQIGPIFSLTAIRSMNPSKTKQYARAIFTHRDKRLFIEGSDGQRLEYQFDEQRDCQRGFLTAVVSDACCSDQFYEYCKHAEMISALNRRLNIDYYSKPEERVKQLSAPIGGMMLPIHTFLYENKKTTVYDAEKNWVEYHYDDQFRIQRLERYSKDGKLQTIERFVWGLLGNLICKVFLDQKRSPVYGKRFYYDQRANLIQEKSYGNLSGLGSPLTLDNDGLPKENGVEIYSQEWRYSDAIPSLLLESKTQDGLRNTYEYLPGTNLLIGQLTYIGGEISQRKFWEYNSDHLLIREVADDGKATNSKDRAGVTVQTIREFTLLEKGPYLGCIATIEEKYWDGSRERLLQKTVLHYGKGGLVEQKDIYDAAGEFRYSESTKYDSKGRIKSKTNALGETAISEPDELGNTVYYKDFGGRNEIRYSYDFRNRVVEKKVKGFDGLEADFQFGTPSVSAEESATKTPEAIAKLPATGKPLFCHPLHLFRLAFSPEMSIAGTERAGKPALANEDKIIDFPGRGSFSTASSYNAYGSPVEVIHPDLSKETYEYFLDGTLKRYTDQMGVVTTYERDAFRQPVRKTIAQKAEETFQYKGQLLVAKVDAEGHRTTFAYDGAGRKISEEFDGEKVRFHYDELGRQHIREKGRIKTVFQFDLLNRIEELREEEIQTGRQLRKTAYRYDSGHNKTAIFRWINEENSQTCEEFEFDSQNRLRSRKDPSGQVKTVVYDKQKVLQKTTTDPMGLESIDTYDTHGQIVRSEKRKGGKVLSVEEKQYNARNLLALQINTVFAPDGSTRTVRTKWEYDPCDRLRTLTEGEGTRHAKVTTYTYTPRGEKKTVTKPDGCVLSYEYSDLGNLELLTSSDGTVRHQMRYNKLGALIWSDGIERKVDGRGRILAESFPNGLLVENTYGEDGAKKTCRIPTANCLIEYQTNGLDLLKVSRKTLHGEELYAHTYVNRDLSGNLLLANLSEDLGSIRFTYNPRGRKKSITAPLFSQKVLEVDAVGNPLRTQTQTHESSFTYDDLYQLTSEKGAFSHDYQYDSLHCRLKKDDEVYQFNALNQPVSPMKYNKNGNPTRQGDIRYTLYTFDALDRLTRIETPERIQTFAYDCLNRRLSSTTLQHGGQKTVYYLYDGQNEIGAFDESAVPLEFRVLGEMGATVGIELQGKVYAVVHDLSGNIATLLPLDHSKPTQYWYGAFGEGMILGPTKSPWRYFSKRVDETGLVYFGQRFYQPKLGRWLTPDPAGYAFLHNNPLTHF